MIEKSLRPALVNSTTCAQLTGTTQPFILALHKGEDLFPSIIACAKTIGLRSATINGIGALLSASIAYYYETTKTYDTQKFEEPFELLSLHGSLSTVENEYFLHLHGTLGRNDFSVIGGHFMQAIVGPSVELAVTPLSAPIYRKYDADIGLKLMCPIEEL